MNRVLVSLAVVLAVSAVASAQPWLDARDLDGSTPGGTVWELLPDTVTWICIHGDSNGVGIETLMGSETIIDPGVSADPGGNAGPAPTIVGYTNAGGVLNGYDSDWTGFGPTSVFYSCAQWNVPQAIAPCAGQTCLVFIEIDTTGCVPCDWFDLDIIGGACDLYSTGSVPMGCTLTNGEIHILPEPGTITLLVMGVAGLVLRRRRK